MDWRLFLLPAWLLFSSLSFGLPQSAKAQPTVPAADSLALVALYNATNGPGWTTNTNWLTGPVDTWQNITVLNGRVSTVRLQQNQLQGTLPAVLGDLSDLKWLLLYGNNLSGSIPPELGNLNNLTLLYLQHNQLTGSIPSELGNMGALQRLYLYHNQLEGEIPSNLGNLSNLEELRLGENSLTGSIPETLGNLSFLKMLSLIYNDLSGSIPATLANLTNLETLSLYENDLTGSIPQGLGNLSSLEDLGLSSNQLDGAIPPELGNLSNLRQLRLGGNRLTGSIPSSLGNLSNLEILYTYGNQLEGSLPASFASLSKLWTLQVQDNQLTDVPDLSGMPALDRVSVFRNALTFEDIEPLMGAGLTSYIYDLQALVGTPTSETVQQGESLTLHIPVGGANNQYQWFKDGSPIAEATTDTYVITNATMADAGAYTLEITNTLATELTLESHPITVTVVGEPSNVGPEVTITDGPTGAQAPGEVTFVWSGSDPDGTVVGYEWELEGPETANASTTSTSVTLDVQTEGAYTFRVRAEDDDGAFSDWSERTFNVGLTNTLPEVTITEGPKGSVGAGTVVFAWQGSDPDGSIVGYEWELAGPQYAEGTTTSNTLTLEALPEGAYLFRIRAQDNEGAFSDWADQRFAIDVANAPQAQADAVTTPEDMALPAIDVLGNDTDPDGTALSVTGVSEPQFGTASVNTNGTVSYTPDANFHGTDTFVYTVADGDGMTAQGTVTITVTPVNDAPAFTSTPDETTAEGQVYAYTVTTTDVDADVLTLEAVTLPAWLALTDNTNTSALLTGTPMQADVGTHEIVLAVTDGIETIEQAFVLTVTDVNIPPPPATLTALTDGSSMTLEGDPEAVFVVTWTASVDPDGDPLTYRWELAMENTFDPLLFSEDVDTATRFETTIGTIGALLKQEGVEINTSIILFHRVVTSDGVNDIASAPAQITLTRGIITDTESSAGLPEQFTLLGNYPNPFNPETTIRVDVPEAAQVTVVLYDVLGREARRIEAGALAAGTGQTIRISAGDLSSGVYVYRVIGRLASGQVQTVTGRMTLLK